MELTHGSLFSGIGGFELGAQYAGIETLWNCEIEEFNKKILKQHFPKSKQYADIRELRNPEYVDIISGGFPCQDISIANNNTGGAKGIKGERSGLWNEMFRIIRDVRPKYVIIENSPMLLVRGFEYVLCDLSKIGYNAEWQCLSGEEFNLCHKRERVYVVANSEQVRCSYNSEKSRILQEILQKRAPRQDALPMPIKQFNSKSNYESVRMDDEFSRELDKRRIEACGNAVIPTIAQYLFECIKKHNAERLQLQKVA